MATDRRAERHQRTKREIQDAAWRLAGERGLAGWSLRDVAEAVGMRAPSLYVYFDSKSALYDALFAQGYRALLDDIDATSRDGGPTEVLRRAAWTFFDFCVREPARAQLLFLRTVPGFTPSPGSYGLAEQALQRLADVLVDAGAPDPAALDLWTAVLTGLATQQSSNDPGGDRWARLVDRAVDMFVATQIAGPAQPARSS